MEAIMQQLENLYSQKRVLDLKWEQEHLKEGRYTLNMVKIDKKVKEVLSRIRSAEAEKAHLQNKIDDAAPQVSVAT
jgi:ABC-type phosphate transport system auxiliary subunit